jgi:hypothetical protein
VTTQEVSAKIEASTALNALGLMAVNDEENKNCISVH